MSLHPDRTLGECIKKWRLERGLFQEELAKMIRVSEMTIVNWEKGRTEPDLKIGICGEHGGLPESVQFNHSIGLSYVDCSVSRLPIERLTTAHAKLKEKDKKSPEKYDPNTSFSIFF